MRATMRSAFFVLIAAVKFPLICVAIELDCHKEQKFVKVDQAALPTINAIKVLTSANAEFCTIECLDQLGCKSIVFLLSKSENNCLLSDEMNGAQASNVSVTYIKTSHVKRVCETNVCEHGSTCTDICTPPYYDCNCLPTYFKGERCEQNSKCEMTSPCQNGGTCFSSGVEPFYTCSCPSPFAGSVCQTNTKCYTSQCYNGGHCHTQSTYPYFYCWCPWPFVEERCGRNSRCDHNPCHNGGTCHTQGHHPFYHCECSFGHWGGNCEQGVFNPFG